MNLDDQMRDRILKALEINCINFSDTVVFWTNDDTEESLVELLAVAYQFNWTEILHCFPVRGALVYGEIESVHFDQSNGGGGHYNINSVFGKGLVQAYLRANEQDWAGTVLDESFIKELIKRGHNPKEFLIRYSKQYNVPYKNGKSKPEEFVLNIVEGNLNDEGLKNFGNGITDNFAQYNKSVADESVQRKISNTLRFLESYYVKETQAT